MARSIEDEHRRMLRARDAMDRDYALPLDVPNLASVACVSEAHFIRTFKATFGETPHRYLQRRRVERVVPVLPRVRKGVDRGVSAAERAERSHQSAAELRLGLGVELLELLHLRPGLARTFV
jgi:AraC-like DNA-binding protein